MKSNTLRAATLTSTLAFAIGAGGASALAAQFGGGPPPVRFTEAIMGDVRTAVQLTGTVEARRSSLVASEVAGLVTRLGAREGDRVRKGDTLVELRRESLELRLAAAESSLAEAAARLELATASLTRSEQLFADSVISQQHLDDAVSEADAWRARVQQLESDRARLADDLDRSTVRAPYSGVVVAEHTAEGEWIQAGGPVVELMDFTDLEVTVEVPERYFAGLSVGVEADVTFGALGGYSVIGRVRAVVPRANPQSRTFPVKVAVDNSEGRIGVGMLGRVALPVGESAPGVLVPKDAVVSSTGSPLVYVIGEGDVVEPRPVVLGSASGPWVAVTGLVDPGDRVVTRGNERLQPGMTVVPSPIEYDAP